MGVWGMVESGEWRGRRPGGWAGFLLLGCLLGVLGPAGAGAGSAVESGRAIPLRMLVVATEEEAREVVAAVNRGVPFERLAQERSLGPERERGGYLGRVDPATLSPAIREALARTRRGRLSPVVETEGGYAVLQLVSEGVASVLDRVIRQEAEAERLLEEGTAAGERKEFARTVELLRKAVEYHPRLVDAHYNLAIAYRQLGQMPEAREAMRRVVQLRPDDYQARMGLGLWLLEAAEYQEAILHLERATLLRLDSAEAWLRLAQGYEAAGRWREAARSYRQVQGLVAPAQDQAPLLEAILRTAMRAPDGAAAVEAARRLQALRPGHRGFLAVGRALLLQGEAAAAATELEKAVALNAEAVEGRVALGEAYAAARRTEAAAEQWLRAIRLEPANPEHYRRLSRLHEETGRLDLAIVTLRDGLHAAEQAPRSVQAEMSARLANLYQQAGREREAARERERAAALGGS